MSLIESSIEFKLLPKKVISDIYYKERLDLSTINNNKYLIISLSDIKKAFKIFDNMLKDKKVKLSKTKEKEINLNLLNNINYEEIETKLELKQCKINKEEAYPILLKENKEMKKKILELERNIEEIKKEILTIKENQKNVNNKNIELVFENYLKLKQEEEIKKQKEEEIKRQEKEKLIRQEEEEKLKLNDNVNLSNDFHIENVDNVKEFNTLSNGKISTNSKTVAVYSIVRNNERLYELACSKRGIYSTDHYQFNIAIYNILLNKKTNEIFNAHDHWINNIKHYYYSSSKKHFLLSSSSYYSNYRKCEIKLWNISSKNITNELRIDVNNNNDNYYSCNCCCLLFNNEDYFIFSGGSKSKQSGNCTKIFDRGGNFQSSINKSELEQVNYIETAYIKNKPYVLLSGNYHVESYDYNNSSLKKYKAKDKDNKTYSSIINLFTKNNKTYLLCGYSDGSVTVFDFDSSEDNNYFYSIKLGNTSISSLCSLNENFFLVGDNKEIKLIDFDNRDPKKSFKDLGDNYIQGIEKIKIPEKGEIIISYGGNTITLCKLNN